MKNDKFQEKYNKFWNEVNNAIKKQFDSEPVYNESTD